MKIFRALPFLGTALILAASTPWEDFRERYKSIDPRSARWTVCVRDVDAGAGGWRDDDLIISLTVGGDLALEPLGSAVAKDLWSRQGWTDQPHWVLLSPAGELAATGAGLPRGEAVLAGIHAAGGLARWEQRAAFLREHPDQGEARLEAVAQAFRLMRSRAMVLDRQGKVRIPAWHPEANAPQAPAATRLSLPKGPAGEAQADELYREAAGALADLFKVPGWQREIPAINGFLAFWDVSQSAAMRGLFREAAEAIEPFLRADPYRYDFANFWMEARDAAGQAPESPASAILPVPGRPWPTPAILNRLAEPFRRRLDWDGILRLMGDLAAQHPPEPPSRGGWEEYCRLVCAARIQEGLALASQGSWDLAGSALEEARRLGGGHGVRQALLLRGGQWGGASAEREAWRALINQVLARDGARPPAPRPEPPMRLVVMGNPRWILAWSVLHQAPELAPWSVSELRWEAASRETHQRWRKAYGWEPGPRWALFRGDELRLTGETCPNPLGLAGLLEGEGPALLQRYQGVLERQPDHLGVRAARFSVLLARMPDPRLEANLVQDAAMARIALPFGPGAPWKPDLELWGAAAQRLLPRIEEELRCWPSRSALWELWISWARFHPLQPSVLALAESLPYWQPRGDWRVALPYSVQRAVAAELRRQGNFDTMRTWFRTAWEALDHRPLAALRYGERAWIRQRRREEETAIFQPLREALRALGCTYEQAELERVFGAMMGRDAGRR